MEEANVVPVDKSDMQTTDQYHYFLWQGTFLRDYLLCEKTIEFCLENNLISDNPSGFKPGDICIDQLLSILHKIYKSFNDNLEVRSIFLNTSKTFNEVWCNGLMYKLKQNSILGYILNNIVDVLLVLCMGLMYKLKQRSYVQIKTE